MGEPQRPLAQITHSDLDELSVSFTPEGYQYADLESFWKNFISEGPSLSQVLDLLVEIDDKGYSAVDEGLFEGLDVVTDAIDVNQT